MNRKRFGFKKHQGESVFVYYNLHKKCWSVRSNRTRKVLGHVDKIRVENVLFKVSDKGRERVRSEKKKNVHAGVWGTVPSDRNQLRHERREVTYNPYKYEKFVEVDTERTVISASSVYMSNGKVYAANLIYEDGDVRKN